MTKKSVLITGATGVLGRRVTELLSNHSHYEVVNFSGDVTCTKNVEDFFSKNECQVVIHLAAKVPIRDVDADRCGALKVNLFGSALVAEIIGQYHPNAHLIHVSSSHVYKPSDYPLTEDHVTEPSSFYGVTKLMSEMAISEICKFNLQPYTILRVFSMWDEGQSNDFLFGSLKERLSTHDAGNIFDLQGADSVRNFSHSADIASSIKVILDKRLLGIFNIGSDQNMTVREFATAISQKSINIRGVGGSNTLVPDITKFKKQSANHET